MATFKLRDKVKWTKKPGVWSIEAICETTEGVKYWIQQGNFTAFTVREWAIRSDLEVIGA